VTEETLSSSKTVKCPNCNFEFSLYYARAFACQGCPMSVAGCENVRCPKCDTEFSLDKVNITANTASTKHMGQHMSKLMSQYYKEFGENPNR
jgi:hypothetical protein